jgi:predicted nucleic acid-binding protein
MRVYLDNCCFNRPFDDQSQTRIISEAEAKLRIQERIREGALELSWSYILDYENASNPYEERRNAISEWRRYAAFDAEESAEVIARARDLTHIGLRPMDALHLACAICAGCDYFLSTDDGILRHSRNVADIRITDPISFVRELEL